MKATAIRKKIGDVGFDYRVSCLRNGDIWVTPEYGSIQKNDVLMKRLTDLGYDPKMNGTPGSEGQWIINI